MMSVSLKNLQCCRQNAMEIFQFVTIWHVIIKSFLPIYQLSHPKVIMQMVKTCHYIIRKIEI